MPLWLLPTIALSLLCVDDLAFGRHTGDEGLGLVVDFMVGACTGAVVVAALVVGLVIRRARRGHHRTTRAERQIHW